MKQTELQPCCNENASATILSALSGGIQFHLSSIPTSNQEKTQNNQLYYYTLCVHKVMTRIIQSFSIPDGSTAHHRLSEWKREGANISAIIQMLLESGQITDQETRLGDNWPRDWKRPTETVAEKMRNLKCILFDVDGVFTDGTILLDSGGNEQRRFSVIDGHGIALLRNSGLLV